MRSIGLWLALVAALAIPHIVAAQAAASLTVEVEGVHSDQGSVRVSLCGDVKAPFPGACVTYSGTRPAKRGAPVAVTIDNVPPGRYALQGYHDENDDGRPQIPPEGYFFGNGASFPPTFDAAAVTVGAGTNVVHLKMSYAGVETRPKTGSHGAEPPAGVRRSDLREQGLYGELYLPESAGAKRVPGILLIGGSEGGLDNISQMATSFAQQGYAALALAYWNEEGLPTKLEGIPLEYFDRALAWLGHQPRVDAKSLAMLGWSRGAEAALLVASRNPAVHAVLAVAPSSIVWQGLSGGGAGDHAAWTVANRALPFVTPDASRFDPHAMTLLPLFEARLAEADARPETAIPVERIHGPVLLISGSDDRIWPSQRFADRIVARLQGAGFRHPVLNLSYAGAGHFVFVGAPDGQLSRAGTASNGGMLGGTAAANAAAWQDNWSRTLAFLDTALKGDVR